MLIALLMGLAGSTNAQTSLLSPANWTSNDLTPTEQTAWQKISAHLPASQLTKVTVGPLSQRQHNGYLRLELPAACSLFQFRALRVEYTSDNDYIWHGELVDSCGSVRYGTALLMAENGIQHGSIHVGAHHFVLEGFGGKNVLLDLTDPADSLLCGVTDSTGTTLAPIDPEPDVHDETVQPRVDENCDVRVLFLLTENYVNFTSMNTARHVNRLLNYANQTLRNSRIYSTQLEFKLADIIEIDFIDESNRNFGNVLSDMVFSSHSLIQDLMDIHDADLVALFVNRNIMIAESDGSRPIGAVRFVGNTTYPYTALQPRTATFTHELGHILGARHETCDAIETGPSCDDTPSEAHAHVFVGESGNIYKTIMYGLGEPDRIQHFSNPSVLFDWTSTGVENEKDNANVLKDNACQFAQIDTDDTEELEISIAGPNVACPQEALSYSSAIYGGVGPYTYNWQISYDGINYGSTVSTNIYYTPTGTVLQPGERLYLRLTVITGDNQTGIGYFETDMAQNDPTCPIEIVIIPPTTVFGQIQAYPNPATAPSTLEFELLAAAEVNITCDAVSANRPEQLFDGFLPKGTHKVIIPKLEKGFYLVTLQSGNEHLTRKLIVLD